MLTFETVILLLPLFVNVTPRMLTAPVFTLPKLSDVTLAVNAPGVEVTLSVAALLVTFPVTLLTLTENCAPLSEVVVAGVVYAAAVAPLIAAPFFFHW